MRKYPIGLQSFSKIREDNFLYIDKTEIIYKLIESGSYYFLSRPRRFGKSLLLSTIKEIFEGNKELFKGLWIEDKWNWEKKHPVIHLRLSSIDYQKLGLYEALNKELDSISAELNLFLKETDLKSKFRELIRLASENEKVVILIDEYDKPLIDYLSNADQVNENRTVFKSFYSVLKDADEQIRFLFLTGVSRFSKVSLFSDLNHLEDITIDANFNNVVGITQEELETVFEQELNELSSCWNMEKSSLLNEVKEWYNGYSWSGEDSLYNPYSVLNVMKKKNRIFQNYWFETGTPSFFYDLIQKNPSRFFPDKAVLAGPEGLNDLFGPRTEYEGINIINPVTLMFQTGYLTIKGYDFASRSYILDYPNLEVRESTRAHLLSAYSFSKYGEVRPTVAGLSKAFHENDLNQVMLLLDTLFVNIPNTLWIGAKEHFYHAIIYNTFDLLGIIMENERNYAGTRPDITAFTSTHIYVFEFKLDQTAEGALHQIIDRDYFRPFQLDQRKKMAVGVNFSSEKRGVERYLVKEISDQ